MVQVVWEFHVKPDKIAEFERKYSRTGVWTTLFHKSPDYQQTILLRDLKSDGRYMVIDAWQSRASYEKFKTQYAKEYAAIDRECKKLTEKEVLLGTFEEMKDIKGVS